MNIQTTFNKFRALHERLGMPIVENEQTSIGELEAFFRKLQITVPQEAFEAIRLCAGSGLGWSEPFCESVEENLNAQDNDEFDYGEVSFLPLTVVAAEYQQRLEMSEEMDAPNLVIGPVRASYFDEGWIPIATDVGSGRFAIDLNPADGGTYGQVIWIHSDVSLVRVVARSVESFVQYGCNCIRHELGELTEMPRFPFEPSH